MGQSRALPPCLWVLSESSVGRGKWREPWSSVSRSWAQYGHSEVIASWTLQPSFQMYSQAMKMVSDEFIPLPCTHLSDYTPHYRNLWDCLTSGLGLLLSAPSPTQQQPQTSSPSRPWIHSDWDQEGIRSLSHNVTSREEFFELLSSVCSSWGEILAPYHDLGPALAHCLWIAGVSWSVPKSYWESSLC